MTNQLSHATRKASELMLARFVEQHARLGATIETLRELLGQNQNGHQPEPSIADRAAYDDLKERARVNSVVKKARAKFAARPAGRNTPEVWRKRILVILQNAEGQPVAARDIQRQMGMKSNTAYQHLTAAVNDGVISRVPGPKGFYVLGRASKARVATPAKKRGVTLNVKAQRQRSLALLNSFSPDTPRPFQQGHYGKISKLVSNGYLKRTKDGYLRTAKVYEVTP